VTIHSIMRIVLKHMLCQNYYSKNAIKTVQTLTSKQHRMMVKLNVFKIAKKKPTNHSICTCVSNTILPSKKPGETMLISATILVWRPSMVAILLICTQWAREEILVTSIQIQKWQQPSHSSKIRSTKSSLD